MSKPQSHTETPVQNIKLQQFSEDGLILDIGGGGEGLVSRIEGDRVQLYASVTMFSILSPCGSH
jgi:hypothetical protein